MYNKNIKEKMESTIAFIELVKKEQAIYDTTHEDYKNAEKKAKAWKNVSRDVGITVDSCKRKWKNLRDSYTKYLRSFRTGTKTSRKYQYWAHALHMDFLRPFQGPGRAKVDPPPPDMYEYNTTPLTNEYSNGYAYANNVIETKEEEQVMELSIVKVDGADTLPKEKLTPQKKEKTKLEASEMDSISLFFLSLAKSVRVMPRRHQAAVKMLCMKIVSDAEIEIENGACGIETHVSVSNNNPNNFYTQETYTPAQQPIQQQQPEPTNGNYEHFLYVMSPSRVETMIDISSDDEPQPN